MRKPTAVLRLARSRKRVDCRIPYGIQRYGLRILLSGRIFESVYRSLRGSHHLPGRLDAATHRRPGRLQRSDGLHSGICMVLRKGLLRSLPADVDKVDLPRLRIDQILNLEWKYLVPISMVNLILMVLIVVFKLHF